MQCRYTRIVLTLGAMETATPLWQATVAAILALATVGLTCVGWVSLFRRRSCPAMKDRVFLIGLLALTGNVLCGAALFLLPAWMVPQHDRIGTGWASFVLPIVMLLSLSCGVISWRNSGKTLVVASIAGLTLWIFVASTVVI